MFGRLFRATHQRHVITLKNGTTFDGLLVKTYRDVYTLANVKVLTDPREVPQPVDGLIYLERADIDYSQAPRS